MKLSDSHSFTIDLFEGPLDLLWQLIHHNEFDIYAVPLHQITTQYVKKVQELAIPQLDQGAEFIASAAALILLKSKTLLPKQEQQEQQPEEEYDPRFEVIHQLIDYCRFRQAAKELAERGVQQSSLYARGVEEAVAKKNLGIAHLSLDDLASMFRHVLAKANKQKGTIHEEEWRVCDKIKSIRNDLKQKTALTFSQLFTPEKSREELIVIFLALLELMKMGEVEVIQDDSTKEVLIQPQLQLGFKF